MSWLTYILYIFSFLTYIHFIYVVHFSKIIEDVNYGISRMIKTISILYFSHSNFYYIEIFKTSIHQYSVLFFINIFLYNMYYTLFVDSFLIIYLTIFILDTVISNRSLKSIIQIVILTILTIFFPISQKSLLTEICLLIIIFFSFKIILKMSLEEDNEDKNLILRIPYGNNSNTQIIIYQNFDKILSNLLIYYMIVLFLFIINVKIDINVFLLFYVSKMLIFASIFKSVQIIYYTVNYNSLLKYLYEVGDNDDE